MVSVIVSLQTEPATHFSMNTIIGRVFAWMRLNFGFCVGCVHTGGLPMFALQCMTGAPVASYNCHGGTWLKSNLAFTPAATFQDVFPVSAGEPPLPHDAMWSKVAEWSHARYALGAGIGAFFDTGKRENGLVGGHAYSILKAVNATAADGSPLQLIQLRNPWGSFEWNGAWSDGSPLWDQNPAVAVLVGRGVVAEDGCFWMPWADFAANFTTIGTRIHYAPFLSSVPSKVKSKSVVCVCAMCRRVLSQGQPASG
jgi:hypothetical protein